MTPYYDQDGITIYHGDCREMVESLPSGVLITDPPYGVNFAGKTSKFSRVPEGGYTIGDDPEVGPSIVSLMVPRVVRGVVFSGIRRMFDYPRPADIGCVFCPAGAGNGPWGWTLFNPVLYYGTRPKGGRFPASMTAYDISERNGHPCPKPIRWMRWAVAISTEAADVVLDPFMGSGTTLRAAKDLGRRAIGVEIEERYCEIAAKRLSQGVLFGSEVA